MTLCGAGEGCGCVTRTTPATTGAANGSFPTIHVDGGGGADNPWMVTLDDNWATQVSRAIETTPWVGIPFLNQWENYDVSWNFCEFRRVGDIVMLRGLARNLAGGVTTPQTAGVLPEGFRPPRGTLIFAVDKGSNIHARLDVRQDGKVILQWAGATGTAYYGFTGVMFSTTA